jgi:hypothetical protein
VLTPGELNGGQRIDYAHGHDVGQHRGQTLIHHGGTWAGYRSEILRFPNLALSIFCLANLGSISASDLARRVADLCLADFLPAVEELATAAVSAPAQVQEIFLPPEALAARTGTFRNTSTGRIWEIAVRGQSLAASSGPLGFGLAALAPDHFRAVGAPLAIDLFCIAEEGGRVVRWRLEPEGQEPAILERLTPARAEDLGDVAGTYHSDELGVSHEISVAGGVLSLRMNGLPFQVSLTPLTQDQFTVQGILVRLLRGANGKVRGFTANSGRVRNLEFLKRG